MNRKKKEQIELLRLKTGKEKGKWAVTREEEEGIRVLQVVVPRQALEDRKLNDTKKKILKYLKGYEMEQAAVVADPFAAACFELEDALFEARKQELLCHMDYIFEHMPGNHIVLALGKNAAAHFSRQELLSLLLEAKDRYREVSVFCGEKDKMIMDLSEFLYEEWGVVVHLPQREELNMWFFNAGLVFAFREEASEFDGMHFEKGYVLLDLFSEISGRCRRSAKTGSPRGMLFSGLAYEKSGREIPYETAVNLAYQNPDLFQEFHISSVAICALECYNRR